MMRGTTIAMIVLAGFAAAPVAAAPFVAVLFGATPSAHAEVLKTLNPCGAQKLCPSYTIVLIPPAGWQIDTAATAKRGVQILVPKGETFESAAALMYVQVFYHRDTQAPADFARVSNSRWKEQSPDAKITDRPAAERANGKPAFLRFAYENPGQEGQGFELGAFGPDGDRDGNTFMLDVVLSGDAAAVKKAEPTYLAFLKGL